MSALAVGCQVEHHQSPLSHSRLHAGGFAHDGHVDGWKQGQGAADAVDARHLFLGRGEIDQIIGLVGGCKGAECLQQGDQSATAVVASQSVEPVALDGGCEWVSCPALHRFYGVYMGVEQQRGAPLGVVGRDGPDVVGLAVGLKTIVVDACLKQVGSLGLIPAYRWDGNQ